MTKDKFYAQWRQYQYYIIIGVISLIALFFLPLVGSEAGLAWRLPNTTAGWIVYVVSKLIVATLNILIFHCFILQAQVNIRDNPKYLEACELLSTISPNEETTPKSPIEWKKTVYGKKGVAIFFTSVISAVGLTQAVLTFDWVSMLTYLFTILMGLIFGILQMNQTEIYWTTEFPQYAKKVKKDMDLAQEALLEQEHDTSDSDRGADILVSADCDSSPSATD